ESQALLDALAESHQPQSSLLLLVNYRPDYEHAWGAHVHYSELRLSALPNENVSELLDALVGRDATLEPLRQLLIARTGGNPFFLEERVRALRETRELVGEPGAHPLPPAPRRPARPAHGPGGAPRAGRPPPPPRQAPARPR